MNLAVRYRIEYLLDGTVLEGIVDQRQYAVATAQIVMYLEDCPELFLNLYPDIIEYSYDDDALELLIPALSTEWIETPIRPEENPRLMRACQTGELSLRIVTPFEERAFRASHALSGRWMSENPDSWMPSNVRERLLIRIGRDGTPSAHDAATKVHTIQEAPADGEHLIVLKNLVLPPRSTCIFCDALQPDTREHALPAWATEPDSTGITVESCGRCNNGLSQLEHAVSDISRRDSSDLSPGERLLVGEWAIKTIWVIGKALGVDPLRGSGDDLVSRLIGASAPRSSTSSHQIREVYSSVESSESLSFLKYSGAATTTPWALLRVANLVTSVWFEP